MNTHDIQQQLRDYVATTANMVARAKHHEERVANECRAATQALENFQVSTAQRVTAAIRHNKEFELPHDDGGLKAEADRVNGQLQILNIVGVWLEREHAAAVKALEDAQATEESA